MEWVKVLADGQLGEGTRQVVKVGKRSILLLRQNGKLHAVDNICPHLKAPLKRGKLTDDGAIVCPFHRSVFDLDSGAVRAWCTFPPVVNKALGAISKEKPLPVFQTRVDEGSIWVGVEAA
jgi:nitrite reductase/ring-hydroxylating ferredoxin subunit